MANSVMLDRIGPDWPLGFIKVVTPGAPVGIMSLVDASGVNNPTAPTPGTTGANEYTVMFQQIQFQAFKPGASHGTQNNTGNIYVCRTGVQGAGNRDDPGAIIATLTPGQTWVLSSSAVDRNVFGPYRYFIDADNANDGAFVTGWVAG